MYRKLRYSLSSSMQFLAFLSALQAVRQLRLHPLSQLELWVCNNYNTDWQFLIHLLSRSAIAKHHQRCNRHRLPIHPGAHLGTGKARDFRQRELNAIALSQQAKSVFILAKKFLTARFAYKSRLRTNLCKNRKIVKSQLLRKTGCYCRFLENY